MFPYCFRYFRFSTSPLQRSSIEGGKNQRIKRDRELSSFIEQSSFEPVAFWLSAFATKLVCARKGGETVPEIHVFRGSERERKRWREEGGGEVKRDKRK